MAKRSSYVCQQCGYKSPSTLGKCPECGSWNSFVEVVEEKTLASGKHSKWVDGQVSKPVPLPSITLSEKTRISTGMEEFDRVLGGGMLKGAVMLLSGDPGIGKSTILLHVVLKLLAEGQTVLYVSGEESLEQIKLRVNRLMEGKKDIDFSKFYLVNETIVEAILAQVEDIKPDFLIVDSIQTMETEELTGMAGSVGQVRESAAKLLREAKRRNIPTFLVGHVTKEGTIAGPQVLSHMVDAVLFFEGERYQSLRILRGMKNRFGPVDEVGLFEMTEQGFKEVNNAESLFLSSDKNLPGKAVTITLEGTRPLVCEIQALVVSSKLAFPRRVVSGVDQKRVELMIAVLQKLLKLPLEQFDVFVSTTAGLKLSEPAVDLALCLAILSSFKNKPLKSGVVAISEVSLLGELRPASQLERRIKEAKRMGFDIIMSYPASKTLPDVTSKVLI